MTIPQRMIPKEVAEGQEHQDNQILNEVPGRFANFGYGYQWVSEDGCVTDGPLPDLENVKSSSSEGSWPIVGGLPAYRRRA